MHLTKHTDISLRVLMHLAMHPGKMTTVTAIAEAYNVSRNHLVKVVHKLGQNGYLHSVQGRGGGISLAYEPESICVGEVVRLMEQTTELVDCQDVGCPLMNKCILKKALDRATIAFMSVLDEHSVADLVDNKAQLLRLIGRSN